VLAEIDVSNVHQNPLPACLFENSHGLVSYVRGSLKIAFPSCVAPRDRLMLALHGYFDESGTHDSSQAIAVAGYISSAEQWELFSAEWHLALDEWGLDFFHMTDFANRAQKYSSWTDQERRIRFSRLASIIRRHTIASVSIGFLRQSFNLLFDKQTKRFVGGPYGAASAMLFTDVATRMTPLYPSARYAYVFESGGPGHGEVLAAFDANNQDSERREHFKLLSLRFENKRYFAPLQAADILAYEQYKHLPTAAGLESRAVRAELRQLIPDADDPSVKIWGWLPDAALAQFAEVAQKSARYHGKPETAEED
jgi:hypothetical protein